jgi:hypothetical protein
MTSETTPNGQVKFTFAKDDAPIFLDLLNQLLETYQGTPKTPGAIKYWAGQISMTKPTDDNGLQDAQEILEESRLELRSERADLAKGWLDRFKMNLGHDPHVFDLKPDEREEFVAMLNDRRLIIALEAKLTEAEIETRKTGQLPLPKRMALREVNHLGVLIFMTIGEQFERTGVAPFE